MTDKEIKEYLKRNLTIEGRLCRSEIFGKFLRIVISLDGEKVSSVDIKMD